jgi:putative methyltransferase (TIGR04325 family)
MQEKPSQRYGVFGEYATWAQAAADADNYTTDLSIYHRICEEIKNGRSSGRNLMPVFAGLGILNGPANVLDFGGNLGMVYFDVNRIVPDRIASWAVADIPDVCDYGTRHLADGKLGFVTAFNALKPDIVIACHMLQYLEHPYRAIQSLAALKPKAILLHEVPLALAEPEFAVQHLILELGGGRRPVQSLDFKSIMQAIPGYALVSEVVLPAWAPALRVKQAALLFINPSYETAR